MRYVSLKSVSVIFAATVTFVGATALPALADQVEIEAKAASQHCITVIDKAPLGGGESKVIQRHCSDDIQEAQAYAAKLPYPWLLVQWYDGENYDGDSESIYGYSGPCDASGYGISDTGNFRDRISSYRTYGTCTSSKAYKGTKYGGFHREFKNDQNISLGELGAFCGRYENHLNNCVRSIWVWQ